MQLIAIGNSQGIRIPKPLIQQAKLENTELEFIVVEKGLLIRPIHKISREGWAKNIKNVIYQYENQNDKANIDELLDDSDLEDWSW
jgi:antitoxin MazE